MGKVRVLWTCGIAVVALCGLSGAQPAPATAAPIPNRSFEEEQNGAPTGWTAKTWKGTAEFDWSTEGHAGRSLHIRAAEGADVAWIGQVPINRYTRYRLSGWMKTKGVQTSGGRGALIGVQDVERATTEALIGDNKWTRLEVEFATEEQDSIQINCCLGGWGLASGEVWFDDLELEGLGARVLQPTEISINGATTGAPISPYIYSQFIEHLGRCIYGGIWAEMLEDRKFFFAVGAKGSPWETIGGGSTVQMVKEGVYVGEHMPRAKVSGQTPRGLLQRHLCLQKGRKYVGRIVLSGTVDAGPVLVTLVWGDGENMKQTIPIPEVTQDFKTYPLEFRVDGDTEKGILVILANGGGHVNIGPVSLMPDDNVQGMRADTLALLKELNAPAYRWPGGNFVSGYNWKDGIGDRDKRPPRKNPAWKGVEHNDFGMDEFMVFCREVNAEPYIVVNSGLGDVQLALEELQYANGAADTPMGQMRTANGHAEPYGVKWWGIGNEMYGDWQLGHMPLEEYVKKHNAYAEALRAADPSIKLIAVGATGKWSETMLGQCAGHMDLLSEHFYCGEKKGLLSHVRQISDAIQEKVKAHREYHATIPALKEKAVPICMDEWNYWYGAEPYGEIGTQYFLKDALGIAAGLHEFYRSSDVVFMANYAQTVNVIGAIKTSKAAAVFDTTGLVLKLYRQQFGQIPMKVTGQSGALDVMAAWTEDRTAVTVGVVNPTKDSMAVPVVWEGVSLAGTGTRWIITGPDPQSCNKPGAPQEVTLEESAVENIAGSLESPPLSICLYRLAVK